MWSAKRWANVCTSTSTNITVVFKGTDPAALSATLHKRYNEKEKLPAFFVSTRRFYDIIAAQGGASAHQAWP